MAHKYNNPERVVAGVALNYRTELSQLMLDNEEWRTIADALADALYQRGYTADHLVALDNFERKLDGRFRLVDSPDVPKV